MNLFDDIRPYNDSEIPAVMQRFAENEELSVIMNELFPSVDVEKLKNKIRNIQTSSQFQSEIMVAMVEGVVRQSTSGFDVSGLENIREKKPYLFVSNHRDIVLDAMLLQYVLLKEGHKTCHIAFGNNLMFDSLFTDFWKVNKMFQISRGGDRKTFYNSLLHISEYIRFLLTEKGENVWIAQHNGRAKDGKDLTDPAIIKMFGMSRRDDMVASIAELNIVPVSVSYEWEPCDRLKAIETTVSLHQKYEKKPGEDLNSVLTGIKQPKGYVHFHISPVVTANDLEKLDNGAPCAFYKQVAELIDARIGSSYRLYPNNYIAHDLRSGTDNYADLYTSEQKARFLQGMSWIEEYPQLNREELERIYLGIYANPIDSKNQSR